MPDLAAKRRQNAAHAQAVGITNRGKKKPQRGERNSTSTGRFRLQENIHLILGRRQSLRQSPAVVF
ncbi:MAG: hypothetical protein ACRD3B_09335, partial [Candidatus Sulfotelmatobacter sp.]